MCDEWFFVVLLYRWRFLFVRGGGGDSDGFLAGRA